MSTNAVPLVSFTDEGKSLVRIVEHVAIWRLVVTADWWGLVVQHFAALINALTKRMTLR
jgi:hypothetical protein